MNSDKSDDQKLPDGWVLCKSKSNPGKNYYFNKKSGKSSWTQPQESEKMNKSSSKYEHTKNFERKKKEELAKKGVKRKSDSYEGNASNKKFKQDSNDATPNTSKRETTPRKIKVEELPKFTSTPRKTTPSKSSNRKTEIQVKKTHGKNLANTRLSHLRTVLNSEVQGEESIVNETPKTTDRKSPSSNLNDSRTTQSPSSDSLQSIPSPSQFFAANKIICSMKAQLPEEFCGKEKQKDTFADIEKEICSQTTEYPFSKHPATPPQFSEASKLVSAIKSKLAYRGSTSKETKTFSSAKERMENLRTSLSFEDNEISSNSNSFLSTSINNLKNGEAMDVEDFKEVKLKSPPIRRDSNGGDNVVLVVDTNIFIHDLDFIKNVLNSHIKGYSEQPTLLVPWRVINELDRLKDNNNGNGSLCKRAKAAMDYLYKSLPENSRIKGQSLRDANSHIYPCEVADDEILNCSLQQAERGRNVILVTNDKNLSNKATINNVKRIDVNELKRLVENKPQPISDPDLLASVKHYQHTLYHLLANILENEMRAKYNNLWQRVLFKPPPWSLLDVLQCLLKHWIAVFNEVFPRIEQLMTDLKNSLASIETKDPNTLTQSEMVNFKELCLDVAKKCRIIPEYMELAKMTVERLLREEREEIQTETQDVQREVVEAFEGMWTVLSSYSAKLSSALGIEHSIEDKLPGTESLYVLSGKWTQFNGHVNDLMSAINSILNSEGASSEASLSTLLRVFRATVGVSSHVTRESVASFCATCRNMLQEAYNKFSQLAEILNLCRSRFSTDMG